MKHWIARHHTSLIPWYRLIFNGLAVILLVPPLAFMWHLSSERLWHWQGISTWIAYGLAGSALLGFIWSLKFYDLGEFLGLRQAREQIQDVQDQEGFQISPLHRFVRHPWYSLGLVLLWTQEMDPARLVSALAISLYFIVGSYLEEKKLLIYHGERYRRYRQLVPGFIPSPWRYLSKEQVEGLVDRSS
ncbi:MAG: hypothetical protein QNJ78_02925 [Gammaproteobacteria bacterium]|nr:hypothetical protein [Gammaproteobacteria bacterium]